MAREVARLCESIQCQKRDTPPSLTPTKRTISAIGMSASNFFPSESMNSVLRDVIQQRQHCAIPPPAPPNIPYTLRLEMQAKDFVRNVFRV